MKDNKYPELRFVEFSGPWKTFTLKELSKNINTGKSSYNKNEKTSKYPYPILGSTSIIGYDDTFDYEGNFILTARVGANAGNLYLYSGKAKITDNTVFIQGENIDFLYAFLTQFNLKKLSFGSGQPLIKSSELKEIKVNSPDSTERREIGSFFNKMDHVITLYQQELDTLKQTKQGFLQKMFPNEGESIPQFRFPSFNEKWKEHKLGELGNTFTGLSGKTKEDFGHGSAEFVTYMNVFRNPISDIKMTENVEVDPKQNELQFGDVLFTTSSETPHEVGMSSVWLDNRKNVYLNSFCFGYRPIANVNPLFLAYSLRSKSIRKQLMLLAQGISRYNISKTKAMEILVKLPGVEEQIKIGNFFKQLDDVIALHQQELDALKQTQKAFLQKMFV